MPCILNRSALKFLLEIFIRHKVFLTMLKSLPNMLAYCLMLSNPYYAKYHAGIIDTSLATGINREAITNRNQYHMTASSWHSANTLYLTSHEAPPNIL